MCFSYREVGSCVPRLLPSTFPGDAGLVGGFVFMGPRPLGRGSGAMRELADHRLDLGDHALRRGVLHHVTDIRHTISFAFGTAFANGRERRGSSARSCLRVGPRYRPKAAIAPCPRSAME